MLFVLSPGGAWEAVPYSGPDDLASGGAGYARKAMVFNGQRGLTVVFVSWDGGSSSTDGFLSSSPGLWVPGFRPPMFAPWSPVVGAVPALPDDLLFGPRLLGVPAAALLRLVSAPGFPDALSVMET